MEEELESALRHIAQLLTGRAPNDVAWWMCSNHPKFLLGHKNLDVDKIKAMATLAGAPPTGKDWDSWFDRVRALSVPNGDRA